MNGLQIPYYDFFQNRLSNNRPKLLLLDVPVMISGWHPVQNRKIVEVGKELGRLLTTYLKKNP